ncbi:MAG: PAS domain S-box protein, partial [Planctomycetales bacterium]
YNHEQVVANNDVFWARVHPDDRPRIESSIRQALETQSIYEIEHRVVLEDGNERIVHERGEIFPDLTTGKPLKFIGTIQDITERKLAKEAITTYLEYLTVAVAWTDDQNRVEYMNRQVTELFGYELSDVPDMNTWFQLAFPDPDYRAKVIETWVPALEVARKIGGTIGPIEVTVTCKDGSKRFVSSSGRIVGTRQVVTFNDLTERKQAENALIRSEGRSRAVLKALPDLMFLMNSDGVILDYHAANEDELYVSPEVFLGKRMDDLLPEPVASLFRENRDRVHGTAQSQVFEYDLEIPRIGKTSFEARMTLSGERETITIVRNITDRLKLEEQLRQSQKMEAVGRLAGGIAHDFNNLLTVITGYTSLVMSSVSTDNPHYEALKQVLDAGQSAADLINRLLAFSRQQVLQPRELDLNDVVRSVEIMLRRLIGRSIIVTSSPGMLTHRIKADPVQIEQVLINLAINARDAMPQGGALRISTEEILLTEEDVAANTSLRPGRFAVLTVRDSGHGIPADIIHQIFEPFFTTKDPGKGTGLGLATVHGIVMQSGGSITVESEPAQGTTFRVYFPCLEKPSQSASTVFQNRTTIASARKTLLIVDDDPALRAFISRVLTTQGHQVFEAINGQKALEAIRAHSAEIDLVITDQAMPEMTGKELMERMQLNYPRLKFLLMSGYSEDSMLRENIERDFVSFLAKPFTPADLLAKVEQLTQCSPSA